MPYTTINKSSDHFNIKLYVGNGSDGHSITGVGFKPDWVWTKNRDHAADHYVHDIVRGVEKAIRPNVASGTYDTSINLQSFDTDGFTVGTQDGLNNCNAYYNILACKINHVTILMQQYNLRN